MSFFRDTDFEKVTKSEPGNKTEAFNNIKSSKMLLMALRKEYENVIITSTNTSICIAVNNDMYTISYVATFINIKFNKELVYRKEYNKPTIIGEIINVIRKYSVKKVVVKKDEFNPTLDNLYNSKNLVTLLEKSLWKNTIVMRLLGSNSLCVQIGNTGYSVIIKALTMDPKSELVMIYNDITIATLTGINTFNALSMTIFEIIHKHYSSASNFKEELAMNSIEKFMKSTANKRELGKYFNVVEYAEFLEGSTIGKIVLDKNNVSLELSNDGKHILLYVNNKKLNDIEVTDNAKSYNDSRTIFNKLKKLPSDKPPKEKVTIQQKVDAAPNTETKSFIEICFKSKMFKDRLDAIYSNQWYTELSPDNKTITVVPIDSEKTYYINQTGENVITITCEGSSLAHDIVFGNVPSNSYRKIVKTINTGFDVPVTKKIKPLKVKAEDIDASRSLIEESIKDDSNAVKNVVDPVLYISPELSTYGNVPEFQSNKNKINMLVGSYKFMKYLEDNIPKFNNISFSRYYHTSLEKVDTQEEPHTDILYKIYTIGRITVDEVNKYKYSIFDQNSGSIDIDTVLSTGVWVGLLSALLTHITNLDSLNTAVQKLPPLPLKQDSVLMRSIVGDVGINTTGDILPNKLVDENIQQPVDEDTKESKPTEKALLKALLNNFSFRHNLGKNIIQYKYIRLDLHHEVSTDKYSIYIYYKDKAFADISINDNIYSLNIWKSLMNPGSTISADSLLSSGGMWNLLFTEINKATIRIDGNKIVNPFSPNEEHCGPLYDSNLNLIMNYHQPLGPNDFIGDIYDGILNSISHQPIPREEYSTRINNLEQNKSVLSKIIKPLKQNDFYVPEAPKQYNKFEDVLAMIDLVTHINNNTSFYESITRNKIAFADYTINDVSKDIGYIRILSNSVIRIFEVEIIEGIMSVYLNGSTSKYQVDGTKDQNYSKYLLEILETFGNTITLEKSGGLRQHRYDKTIKLSYEYSSL